MSKNNWWGELLLDTSPPSCPTRRFLENLSKVGSQAGPGDRKVLKHYFEQVSVRGHQRWAPPRLEHQGGGEVGEDVDGGRCVGVTGRDKVVMGMVQKRRMGLAGMG